MKKVLLITIISLAWSIVSCLAQEQKTANSFVTPSMAKKISYSCQYNERMQWLFATANQINFSSEADKILRTLDKHLVYAEKFFLALFYNYGMEKGYWALKDMGLTISEINTIQDIWKKEEDRQKIIIDKKRKEKEQALSKRIKENGVFTKDFLSVQPDIEIDIANIATYTVFNDKDELMNYEYECIISKDGKLSLENPADTLNYSAMQKFIYQYISDENMGGGVYKAGYIEINGKDIPVNSYINIKFNEQRSKHKGYLDLTIKRNKKTGQWEILSDSSSDLMPWTCDEPEQLKSDLESAFYNCPELQEKKGKIQLKIDVYKRILSSNISDKIELSHYFKIMYRNASFGGYGEYIPLEYKISF